MSKIKEGDTIEVNYVGKLNDGTEFDNSSNQGETFTFTVGSDEILPAFSQAVIGLEVGQDTTFRLESEEAYGPRLEEAVQKVPKDQLPADLNTSPGDLIQGARPDGSIFLAKVTEDLGDDVMIDFNHPLAGEDLNFDVTVVSIS
mgnify:CR=1 FL=1|tara:strand:- start:18 stop:449 length:432 start_codon:yes stop_codon:yes gene_type:complete